MGGAVGSLCPRPRTTRGASYVLNTAPVFLEGLARRPQLAACPDSAPAFVERRERRRWAELPGGVCALCLLQDGHAAGQAGGVIVNQGSSRFLVPVARRYRLILTVELTETLPCGWLGCLREKCMSAKGLVRRVPRAVGALAFMAAVIEHATDTILVF